ncbi:hypothetical protein [Telluribacter sp. SYSU D00476]|uniref:monooxygenase n=1 Tax=Telluribacter sp. SYSU D00476 TaxID=2811430 RepID=UPI001FF43075|nr:hypothetical protein [Telluribacter sp. SYSU D00476]
MKKIYFYGLLLAATASAVVSCKENTPATEPAELATYDLIQDRILTPTCATAGCHASESDNSFRQHSLVLAKGKSYENLINKLSSQPDAKSEGMMRVKPYNSNESLLYHKLNWDTSHHGGKQYGLPMPMGGEPLSVGQTEFIRRWIEAGAPRTGNVVDTTLLSDKTPANQVEFEGLTAPAAGQGVQMRLGPFEVAPNFERELFSRRMVGNNEELYVHRVEIKMRPGSHHFILYDFADKSKLPALNDLRDLRNANGGINFGTFASMQNHVFWTGTQTPSHDYTFPEGAALRVPAGASYDMNSHYVNKTDQTMRGEVHVNLYTTPKEKVKHVVESLNLANENLNLAAGQRTTVSKTFTFKKPIKVLMLTSHTHSRGEKFVIRINGGPRNGEVVYESTDWEHPLIKNFPAPIELKAGEGLTSEITYNNTTNQTIRFGLTSEEEMGIIFGYYYEE